MKRVPDRRRQRREYLRKKGQAYTRVTFGLVFLILLSLVLAFVAFGTLNTLIIAVCYYRGEIKCVYLGVALIIMSALLVRQSARTLRKGAEEVRSLPYLPPVNASTLPADEVLVRGAE